MTDKEREDYLETVVQSLRTKLEKHEGFTKNPIRTSMVELKEGADDAK